MGDLKRNELDRTWTSGQPRICSFRRECVSDPPQSFGVSPFRKT